MWGSNKMEFIVFNWLRSQFGVGLTASFIIYIYWMQLKKESLQQISP